MIAPGGSLEQPFQVTNRSAHRVTLTGLRLSRNAQGAFTTQGPRFPAHIDPGHRLQLALRVRPTHMGVLRTALLLDFDAPAAPSFAVGRLVTAWCGDRTHEDILAPSRPYEKKRRRRRPGRVGPPDLDGERPPGADRRFQVPLPPYDIPRHLRRTPQASLPALLADLRARLPAAYADFFSTLLWIEELGMEADIRSYDMERARMQPEGAFLALQLVPAIAVQDAVRPHAAKRSELASTLHEDDRRQLAAKARREKPQGSLRFRREAARLGEQLRRWIALAPTMHRRRVPWE